MGTEDADDDAAPFRDAGRAFSDTASPARRISMMNRPSVLAVLVLMIAGCGDGDTADDPNGGDGGTSTQTGGGGAGGHGASGQGGAGGGEADNWTNFADAWFDEYCVACHSGGNRDFTNYAGVVPDVATIRCGVTPVSLADCNGFPPPKQFPIGTGAKPDDASRQRLVDWIEAGLPE